jgi:XTP/dITP diphosphohydrolase
MQELLIATRNPGKIGELTAWLSERGFPCKTLRDFPASTEVDESGETFEENARLKARSYFEMTGLPALADDGGFEIDALGGLPGVRSKRWVHGDREATDEEIVEHTLRAMETVPDDRRTARLRTVLALYDGSSFALSQAWVEGAVTREARPYAPGFPYRGLLFIPQFGKMYGALTEEQHEALNHRRIALEKLRPELLRVLGK